MRLASVVGLALTVTACASTPAPIRVESRKGAGELRSEGVSGTATDPFGRVWAAPEERDYLYRFDLPMTQPPRATRVPLQNRPPGLEVESLAWLDRRHVVLGTETDEPRSADRVLVGRLSDDGVVRVLGWWMLHWDELWGVTAAANEGIEALCAAGGVVLAGGETALVIDGTRWAPIATARLEGRGIEPWVPSRLRLTTTTGKLAALDCSIDDPGEIEVYGVERDYGVTRLLHFEVPIGHTGEIVPEVVADLARAIHPLPNMESVSVQGERLLIFTDHDTSDQVGDTETLWVGPLDD